MTVREDLDFVASTIRDGYWRLDAAGTVVEANPTLCDWAGLTAEELIGRPAATVAEVADSLLREGEMEATIAERKLVLRSRASGSGWVQVLIPERRAAPTPKPAEKANADLPLPDQDVFFQLLEEAESVAHRLPFSLLLIQSETSGERDEEFGKRVRNLLRTSDIVARIDEGGYAIILRGTPKAAALEAAQRLAKALGASDPWQFGMSHSADGIDDIIARAQDDLGALRS